MGSKHELKIQKEYFEGVLSGKKKAEHRFNDRDYQVDDELILREYDSKKKRYTGRCVRVFVTWITNYPPALKEGFVCMSIHFDGKLRKYNRFKGTTK